MNSALTLTGDNEKPLVDSRVMADYLDRIPTRCASMGQCDFKSH